MHTHTHTHAHLHTYLDKHMVVESEIEVVRKINAVQMLAAKRWEGSP